ncbi:MAG: hypothetical protein IKR11_12595 [Solobacterium sp.]|nr:hypothetical protein [Solobacterium sp.]
MAKYSILIEYDDSMDKTVDEAFEIIRGNIESSLGGFVIRIEKEVEIWSRNP